MSSGTMEQNIKHGIKENLFQFTLLVILTAFIGGMVGMERSLIPQLAQKEFNLSSKTAMLSFIIAFGVTKAITNYFTGNLSNRFGRKTLLITGWLFALPIPWLLMYAPSWNLIIVANILLGLNQGLAWSSTVVMKIDLVGEKGRGLAIGLNEFAGYLAVGLVTFLVAYIAATYGLRPYPFFVGVVFSVVGLLISVFVIKDTRQHMTKAAEAKFSERFTLLKNVFWGTTIYNRNLSAVVQAGMVNNLNDGMIWGLYPLLLTTRGFDLKQIGVLTAIYPAFWGIGQLISGRLSDIVQKKTLLFIGMFFQAVTLVLMLKATTYVHFLTLSIILGLGKALVYPTFTTSIAENNHPLQRAGSIGVFRFWRDGGYAIGAVLAGILSDQFGITTAFLSIGLLTFLSSLIIKLRMKTIAIAA
jgi:MFS family permease